MTPRELTAGAIRQLPADEHTERKPHGRVTDLVRKERCGVVVYEGRCDGTAVCIVEHGLGHWVMRSADRMVDEGALVDVLGVQLRDEWCIPGCRPLRVTVLSNDRDWIEAAGNGRRVSASARLMLDIGWRPAHMTQLALIIVFRRNGNGWLGSQLVRASDAQWPGVELHVTVLGQTRNGRHYPHSFSASLRRLDGGGEASVLLNRRCTSLTNIAWQIERAGFTDAMALLDREPQR